MMLPVLDLYPQEYRRFSWRCLDTAGGMSGARIWQGIDGQSPRYALKCWPRDYPVTRLLQIHRWMEHARHTDCCSFVPRVISTLPLQTAVTMHGQVWDMTDWCAGAATFALAPNRSKLAAMMDALARLHRAWEPKTSELQPAPGILRRLRVLQQDLLPIDSDVLSQRATAIVQEYRPLLLKQLAPWSERCLLVQPCHCDPRHDHWLFDGDKLCGLIDFGSAKWDSPAIDVARCLGETAYHDTDLYRYGEECYYHSRGRRDFPESLTRLLAVATTVGAVYAWWEKRRCLQSVSLSNRDGGYPIDLSAVTQRLEVLVTRLENSPVFREVLG